MKNNVPSGVVQFFKPLSSIRRKTENSLIDFFESKGYNEVVTSLFSYEDSIFEGLFEPLKTQLFKIVDKNSGQTMVLRADITMQITQAVIMGRFDMPVKVCYADNIYRDTEEHSGKKREFRQIGIELFGIKEISADEEVVDIAISSLEKLGVENMYLRLSDTYILDGLLKDYGIGDTVQINAIKELLQKKSLDLILKRFRGLQRGFVDKLKLLNKKSGYFSDNKDYDDIDEYVCNIITLANNIKKRHENISVFLDLFYCEYPAYHHGIVFDIFSGNINLAVGGRYGNVTRQFGKYIPATGLSINLDELTYFLFDKERQ